MLNNFKSSIRKRVFQQPYALDTQLIALARQSPQHAFLTNPSALLIYTYLVEYMRIFSGEWFEDRPLDILDWGTGKGHITFLLQQHFQRKACVVSCDVASEELAHNDSSFWQDTPIIKGANLEVVPLYHPYQLPFTDNSFDVVVSMGVLEHVPHDQQSLHEIRRILRPRGLFFCFFLPYRWSWTQRLSYARGNYYHDRLYTKQQVKRMTAKAHLALLDIWHRQLLPKNAIHYPAYHQVESLDQWVSTHTPLKYLATNIEFVAYKM